MTDELDALVGWIPPEALADLIAQVQGYADLHRDAWPLEVDFRRDDGTLTMCLAFHGETLASILHNTAHLTDRQVEMGRLIWMLAAQEVCSGRIRLGSGRH